MDISQLIAEDLILFDDSIRSKKSLFEHLGNVLETTGRITSSKKIIKAFFEREKEVSTGVEEGFGIPHAKSKYVLMPTVCFVHSGKIVEYLGMDDEPIECVFAIVVPSKALNNHLEILSALSRRLVDPFFRKQIKEATTASEIIAILKEDENN
ncbi:MAG: PTS sugar transporter subunit IIA [Enterococcus lacertideformus]|uniref:PTS sugar transporter subunit IIA n=1 Tax=Enterococcus lacertideformus TaxID=2771493 RepID=A0A931F997_9ENTE|nr:PTS sugar transporter subunit IIA [Enterococcus lacertideformus]